MNDPAERAAANECSAEPEGGWQAFYLREKELWEEREAAAVETARLEERGKFMDAIAVDIIRECRHQLSLGVEHLEKYLSQAESCWGGALDRLRSQIREQTLEDNER